MSLTEHEEEIRERMWLNVINPVMEKYLGEKISEASAANIIYHQSFSFIQLIIFKELAEAINKLTEEIKAKKQDVR